MIKLVIFDLDGVLIESREMHFETLNAALHEIDPKYVISKEEHLSTYDGLPTTKKLNMLSDNRGLPESLHKRIWALKQEWTKAYIEEEIAIDPGKLGLFQTLKSKDLKIGVCSNSVRDNTRLILNKLGLLKYVDYYFTNQDVRNTKPHPEMYMRCMIEAQISPKETLIIEDSHIGREAAETSGAHLLGVRNSSEVTLQEVMNEIDLLNGKTHKKPRWQGGKMNVLIPMAGAGSRFAAAGYTFPKPLIEIQGKPMIQVVVENLNIDARYIYLVQKEHYEKYNLKQFLNLLTPNCEIVQVDGITEGAACTTLLAADLINTDEPLVIANSDQFAVWNSNTFMYSVSADNIDGGILTFKATHPKWSFARTDERGFVAEVAEKKPISDNATVGIYYWKKGSDYVKYADYMIANDTRVNNEFYVCPVFNEAIRDGKKIRIYPIEKMYGLGTPEDLNTFLQSEIKV